MDIIRKASIAYDINQLYSQILPGHMAPSLIYSAYTFLIPFISHLSQFFRPNILPLVFKSHMPSPFVSICIKVFTSSSCDYQTRMRRSPTRPLRVLVSPSRPHRDPTETISCVAKKKSDRHSWPTVTPLRPPYDTLCCPLILLLVDHVTRRNSILSISIRGLPSLSPALCLACDANALAQLDLMLCTFPGVATGPQLEQQQEQEQALDWLQLV